MSREKDIYRVTLVGGIGNVVLLAFKFIAGFLGNSSAMIADAVHSLSDFVTDIVVLVLVGISSKPQDESHDYGHGKYETLATFLIGLALLVAAVGIMSSGGLKLYDWYLGEELEPPTMLALLAAVVSVVVKEGLYQYTVRSGRQLQSEAVVANAWHHRSDALSSLGTMVGIGGAIFLGEKWVMLDPLASVVVGVMLAKVSFGMLRTSVLELTDSSLPQSVETEIEDIIKQSPGVSEPHNMRTRKIGNRIAIETHIRLDGSMTLREAHGVTEEIEDRLRKRFGKGTYVTIHAEPTKER